MLYVKEGQKKINPSMERPEFRDEDLLKTAPSVPLRMAK